MTSIRVTYRQIQAIRKLCLDRTNRGNMFDILKKFGQDSFFQGNKEWAKERILSLLENGI